MYVYMLYSYSYIALQEITFFLIAHTRSSARCFALLPSAKGLFILPSAYIYMYIYGLCFYVHRCYIRIKSIFLGWLYREREIRDCGREDLNFECVGNHRRTYFFHVYKITRKNDIYTSPAIRTKRSNHTRKRNDNISNQTNVDSDAAAVALITRSSSHSIDFREATGEMCTRAHANRPLYTHSKQSSRIIDLFSRWKTQFIYSLFIKTSFACQITP